MRHAIAGNKLGRNSCLRQATIRDIAKATLIEQRICTTKAKAKEARKLVDKLITLGKKGTLADKRRAFAILCHHGIVSDLFIKTAPRFKSRIGGYTRIIPLGTRRGDNAQLAFLELTEKTEVVVSQPKSTAAAKKTYIDVMVAKEKESKVTINPETKEVPIIKESPLKKEPPKPQVTQTPISPEKVKPVKNFMGGIRKMFNRKTGSS